MDRTSEIIADLLAVELQPMTRAEVVAFRDQVEAGNLSDDDDGYLRALHRRLVGDASGPSQLAQSPVWKETPSDWRPEPGPLSEASAKRLTREWISNRIKKPKHSYRYSQMCSLMDALGERCTAEGLKRGVDEDGLCMMLAEAWDVLWAAWYSAAPEYARRYRTADDGPATRDEEEKIEAAKHLLWKRHNLLEAFKEGWESEHHVTIDKGGLTYAIAKYLDRPHLRVPELDWLFLDMTISEEICAYGESIKQRWLPRKRNSWLRVNTGYLAAKGNIAKMIKVNWRQHFEAWWTWAVFVLLIPAGAIWGAFHFDLTSLALWLGGIYLGLWCLYALFCIVRLFRSVVDRLRGVKDPWVRETALYDQMLEVWKRLEGPVVHPGRVREAMAAASSSGAVWYNVSWSMIDRVIAADAAAWVVQK